jgi:uncharacterized protein (DUF362 family)/NAD-dependent dihydropyrimidine dehydrogenase PreA subunit
MTYEVSIVKCDAYDDEKVRNAVEASLAPLGGLENVIKEDDRVLIKLNLLSSKPPEAAVTTHPAIVKSVVTMVQDLGVTPLVGDSPGGGSSAASYKSLLEKTGIQKVIDETGCQSVRFDEATVEVFSDKALKFKKLTLAKTITDVDVIIGLPKLKTHGLTYYTGAIKLLYGYMPGMFKTEYHLHTAGNVNLFSELLLDLHETYTPTINIMDAIVGMDGAGPSNGNPRSIGLVMASKSSTALDYVAVTIAGFAPMEVPTVKLAHERGIGPDSLTDITVYGEEVEPLIMKDFKKPKTMMRFRMPPFLANRLKSVIAVRPRIDTARCKKCGECAKDCPPKAMKFTKGSVPRIDYRACIRCYCCQELCPEGAIDVSMPLVRQILKR